MRFNVNETVSVRLTGRGRAILRQVGVAPKAEDAEGWSRWQLWDLMRQFGGHLYLGCDPPFDLAIEIPDQPDVPVVVGAEGGL